MLRKLSWEVSLWWQDVWELRHSGDGEHRRLKHTKHSQMSSY